MLTPFEVALFFGAIGAALLLASNLMKRMIPLRVLALGSNLFFIVQASIDRNWLHLVLQISLLVVNSYRLWDLWRLGQAIDRANANTPLKDWLLPHMKRRKFTAGTTIFNKGDRANELIYIPQRQGPDRRGGTNPGRRQPDRRDRPLHRDPRAHREHPCARPTASATR